MLLTRRYFLQYCGAVAATYSVASLLPGMRGLLAQDPPAAPANNRKPVLVVIFLRGGADGLNLVPPFGDKNYAKLRPRLAMKAPNDGAPEERCLDLDGSFGLHPRMAAFHGLFKAGELAIVEAVGNPANNRSHFTQQDIWETARIDAALDAEGWLNRHLQSTNGPGPLRAVAISNVLPRMMRGKAPTSAINNVKELTYRNRFGDPVKIAQALKQAYEAETDTKTKEMIAEAGRRTLAELKALEHVATQDYKPTAAAKYPENNGLAVKLRHIAHLIKANIGLEVAQVDLDGWDTHQNQGDRGIGYLGDLAGQLAEAVTAFSRDMGDAMKDVVVMTLTEFGRTAFENGTAGTDHGHASVSFVLGGPVKEKKIGGKILGTWPTLAPEKLNGNRDLAHTTDFRDLIGEVVTNHLGNTALDKVLPNHKPNLPGWLKG